VEVRVHVYDLATKRPLTGATVRQLDSNGTPRRTLTDPPLPTDASGNTTIRIPVGMGGERGLVLDRYGFGDTDNPLEITAGGYSTRTQLAGRSRSFRILRYGPTPRLYVDVPMSRAPATTGSS
jgi:hypothetical protein